MKMILFLFIVFFSNSILSIFCANVFILNAIEDFHTIGVAIQKVQFLRFELAAQAQIQKEFLGTAKRVDELFSDEVVDVKHFWLQNFLKKAIEMIVKEINELTHYTSYIEINYGYPHLPTQMAHFAPEKIIDNIPGANRLAKLKMFAIGKVQNENGNLLDELDILNTLKNFFNQNLYVDPILEELDAVLSVERQPITIVGQAKTAAMNIWDAFKHIANLYLRKINFALEKGERKVVEKTKKELEDTTLARFHFEAMFLKVEALKMIFKTAVEVVEMDGNLEEQMDILEPLKKMAKKQKEKAEDLNKWADISNRLLIKPFMTSLKMEDEKLLIREVAKEEQTRYQKVEEVKGKNIEEYSDAEMKEARDEGRFDIPKKVLRIFCQAAIDKMKLPTTFQHWEQLAMKPDKENEEWKMAFREFTGEDYDPDLNKGQLNEAQMLNNVAAVKMLQIYIEDHRLYMGEYRKRVKEAAEMGEKQKANQDHLGKKKQQAGQSMV